MNSKENRKGMDYELMKGKVNRKQNKKREEKKKENKKKRKIRTTNQ